MPLSVARLSAAISDDAAKAVFDLGRIHLLEESLAAFLLIIVEYGHQSSLYS